MIKIYQKDIDNALEKLLQKIYKPDYIVGIPRGGLWLAQYVSYYFDLHKSKIKFALKQDDIKDLKGRILVTDDIYDTGKQYTHFRNCEFAVLFARDRGLEFPENLKYGSLVTTDEYLWFPWDCE